MRTALRLLRERLAVVLDELKRFELSKLPEDRWSTGRRVERVELEAAIKELEGFQVLKSWMGRY